MTDMQHMTVHGNHLGQAASQPGRALPFEGLLPCVLAIQPHAITLVPAVEAQLWQQQWQQLLSEAVLTIHKQSTHSMTSCQSHLQTGNSVLSDKTSGGASYMQAHRCATSNSSMQKPLDGIVLPNIMWLQSAASQDISQNTNTSIKFNVDWPCLTDQCR